MKVWAQGGPPAVAQGSSLVSIASRRHQRGHLLGALGAPRGVVGADGQPVDVVGEAVQRRRIRRQRQRRHCGAVEAERRPHRGLELGAGQPPQHPLARRLGAGVRAGHLGRRRRRAGAARGRCQPPGLRAARGSTAARVARAARVSSRHRRFGPPPGPAGPPPGPADPCPTASPFTQPKPRRTPNSTSSSAACRFITAPPRWWPSPKWARVGAEHPQHGGHHRLVVAAAGQDVAHALDLAAAAAHQQGGHAVAAVTDRQALGHHHDARCCAGPSCRRVQRIGDVQRLQQPGHLGEVPGLAAARRSSWLPCEVLWCGNPRSTGTMALPSALPACKVATRVCPVTSARAMMSTWASKMSEKYGVLVGVLGVALQHRPQLLDRGQGVAAWRRQASPSAGASSTPATGRSDFSASRCWFSLASSLGMADSRPPSSSISASSRSSESPVKSGAPGAGPGAGAGAATRTRGRTR